MPRSPVTTDAFNAVAEPRRREIIEILAGAGDTPVNELVERLRIPQPAVSKHLRVLRKVGLVTVLRDGQHRRYSLRPQQLKPVHDWVKSFEKLWDDHLSQLKQVAERKARERGWKPKDPKKP